MIGPLISEISLARKGLGDSSGIRQAFARSTLQVPIFDESHLASVPYHGMRFVLVFTTEAEAAMYSRLHDASVDAYSPEFRPVLGEHILTLLEDLTTTHGEPSGLAIDVAGERPLVVPSDSLFY